VIKSVEDLDIYKKAHELILKLYKITKDFPDDEKFRLVSQIGMAAVSINASLLEGSSRIKQKRI